MLTWKLGFRYLWIDGLCILQDSKEDWERHASQMASIFSKSQLTISASRGADGHIGLFTDRAKEPLVLESCNSRKVYNETLWLTREVDGPDRDGARKNFVARLERKHGLYRHNRPKEPLLKRAWVFQEQILSSRIIHFASGELCFECRSHVVCECSDWSLRSDSSQWETRWRKAHSWLLNQGPAHKLQVRSNAQVRHDFEAYRALVERYSELEITAELDRLPALSGVTFGRKDEYLAGMWRSLLLESLHWNPGPTTLNNIMARRPYEYRGPSWSWVSMEAPIQHFETEFSLNQWSAKPIAKIIGVSCTAEGLDPRGRVAGGYLRISGPMDTIRVVDVGLCEQPRSVEETLRRITLKNRPTLADPTLDPLFERDKLVTYATLRKGELEARAYLDCPLALCRSEPAEVAVGDNVIGLVVSSRSCLILKEIPDTPGAYRRVGYFVPNREGWSFANDRGSIFIL
jgi:Heterokaryon incompatibility protein (HET)